MKNSRIMKKLLVSFVITASLICVVGVTSVVSLNGLNNDYSDTVVNHALQLNSAINIVADFQAVCSDMRTCVLHAGDKEMLRKTRRSIDYHCKMFEDSAAAFGRAIVRPDVKALFDESIREYINVFKPGVYKIADDAENGAPQAVLIEYMTNITPSSETITENILKIADIKADRLATFSDECRDLFTKFTAVMVTIIIVGVAVSGVVNFIYIANAVEADGGTEKKTDRFHRA